MLVGRSRAPEHVHERARASGRIVNHTGCRCNPECSPFLCAEIYASELEKRRSDLRQAETALAQAQGDRRISDEKFQKVFRSSPIPFSITTAAEGRFLDVNTAFELRYGYSRKEVLGRTVHELKMWEDPADRVLMIQQLRLGRPIRNVITRLRTKSGEIKLTAYSADRIQFDG